MGGARRAKGARWGVAWGQRVVGTERVKDVGDSVGGKGAQPRATPHSGDAMATMYIHYTLYTESNSQE
jgi:hypothetical protein